MILVIDDDSAVRSSLSFMLKRAGYEVKAVAGPREAIDVVRAEAPALILMDMNFTLSTTGEEGLTLLKQVKIFRPETPVILMTAWGSIQLAVHGMQAGAFDFITKPWNNAALLQRIETALELNAPQTESTVEKADTLDRSHIIGKSRGLMDVLNTVARIARTNASVLITGESGTGKELIAEAIHINSQRAKQPFVKVNLGGISQSLFESEMFGHKKGAFTDATADRVGRFELANKGTIFLDEIGDLDLSCQVKLLRVLQDQTFEVLGDSRPRKVDVRIISATNADLRKMVTEHTFREDLFYRINLITIKLPALPRRHPLVGTLLRRPPGRSQRTTPYGICGRCTELPVETALSRKHPRTEEPCRTYNPRQREIRYHSCRLRHPISAYHRTTPGCRKRIVCQYDLRRNRAPHHTPGTRTPQRKPQPGSPGTGYQPGCPLPQVRKVQHRHQQSSSKLLNRDQRAHQVLLHHPGPDTPGIVRSSGILGNALA